MDDNSINNPICYPESSLKRHDLPIDPIELFQRWYTDVDEANTDVLFEVNAMTLATVSASGVPHARIVLLKSFSQQGFVFFTNYSSLKGKDLAANANVSLLFWWPSFFRQVRIEGVTEILSSQQSDDYFHQRSLESQISASVSKQSQPLASREKLLDEFNQLKKKHSQTGVITRPDNWGGYKVKPSVIEFWQGCEHRLHDRFQYSLVDNDWSLVRLSP
jgi:pyridoxamine 5'-phosphate oxidase